MGPCRTRPRQARPSRVAEVQETRDFTSEQFRRGDTRRVGARSTRAALGTGRPSGPGAGPGRDKRGPPVWPRVYGTRDFTSEQFRSEIPHPQTSGGRAATLRPTRVDRRGDDAFQITILAMNKILLRIEISRLAPHVRGGVAVHFPDRRVVPGGGAPVCTDALNCVPPVATI